MYKKQMYTWHPLTSVLYTSKKEMHAVSVCVNAFCMDTHVHYGGFFILIPHIHVPHHILLCKGQVAFSMYVQNTYG